MLEKSIRGVLPFGHRVEWDQDDIRLCTPNVAKYRIKLISKQTTLFGQRVELREVECVCGGLVNEFNDGQNACPKCNRWLVSLRTNNSPENS